MFAERITSVLSAHSTTTKETIMSSQNVNQHSTDDNKKALQMRVESLRQEQLQTGAPFAPPPALALIGTIGLSCFIGFFAAFVPMSLGRGPQIGWALLKALGIGIIGTVVLFLGWDPATGDQPMLFPGLLMWGAAILYFEIAIYYHAYMAAEDRCLEREAYDQALLEDLEERANAA